MKRLVILGAVAVLTLGAIGTVAADDDHNKSRDVKAVLSGYNEVPSISTAGTGKLRLKIDGSNTTATYTLTFSGLEGAVTGAHLHLGKPGVAGGVIINLCPTTCVSPVSSTFNATNVVPTVSPAQGIAGPADWAEVLKAIRAGAVYANVHTTAFPAGEIRGQLSGGWGK